MWDDVYFYEVLAEPNAFGPAFVTWFNTGHDQNAQYAPRWWYGMVLIGDPALIPNGDYDAPEAPTGLAAESGDGQVDLSWAPSPAPDLHVYHVYRGTDRATPGYLDTVPASDTTYGDTDVVSGVCYTYWVTAVDSSTNESPYSDPDSVTYTTTDAASLDRLPEPSVFSARPNPFNPSTEILYSLGNTGPVRLAIYDVAGKRVRTLVDGTHARGVHAVRWDGCDESGAPVGSGVYLARLVRGDNTLQTLKLLLLK